MCIFGIFVRNAENPRGSPGLVNASSLFNSVPLSIPAVCPVEEQISAGFLPPLLGSKFSVLSITLGAACSCWSGQTGSESLNTLISLPPALIIKEQRCCSDMLQQLSVKTHHHFCQHYYHCFHYICNSFILTPSFFPVV